jgi:hypothetical protein
MPIHRLRWSSPDGYARCGFPAGFSAGYLEHGSGGTSGKASMWAAGIVPSEPSREVGGAAVGRAVGRSVGPVPQVADAEKARSSLTVRFIFWSYNNTEAEGYDKIA